MLRLLFILLISMSAIHCSSSKDAVIDALDGTPITDPKNKDAQVIPHDVPSIPVGASYFGKLKLIPNEKLEYNLIDGNDFKVVDFEFTDKNFKDFFVDQFSSVYMGSCPDRKEKLTWLHVDKNGKTLASEPINLVDVFTAVAGYRYILRIEYRNVKHCQQIYSTLKVLED